MPQASEFLIDIAAHNGTALETFRVSSSGYTTRPNDDPPNAEYARAVLEPGYFDQSLFAPKRTTGASEVDMGRIVLDNQDGSFDGIRDHGFGGRPVTVRRLDGPRAAFSSAQLLLRGTVLRVESSQAMQKLTFQLRDRRQELRKPLQVNRYSGATISGGLVDNLINGTADMKDQVKPLALGRCFGLPATWVNPFDLIVQFNDGPLASIVLYDAGVPLTHIGNFASAAALQSAAIRPGQYGTCLALGLARLGGNPWGEISADVIEGSTPADRTAGAIVQRMLARLGQTGSANIDLPSFAALNALAPQQLGIYSDDGAEALDLMSRVLDSIGGYIIPNPAGAFEVGRFSGVGAPAWDISYPMIHGGDVVLESNTDTDSGVPIWRQILRHSRVWGPQDVAKIGSYLSADRKAFLSTEWRDAKAENADTLVKHLLAGEMTVETMLTDAADADAEAARRLTLYGVSRDTLTLALRRDDAGAMGLNTSGMVTYPRHGFASGKPMVVIGRREDPKNELVNLTLWG